MLSTRLAFDYSMTARRSFLELYALLVACDFLLSLLLRSHALFALLFSLGRSMERSYESGTPVSSSSSDEELGRVRMTWTCRRL